MAAIAASEKKGTEKIDLNLHSEKYLEFLKEKLESFVMRKALDEIEKGAEAAKKKEELLKKEITLEAIEESKIHSENMLN